MKQLVKESVAHEQALQLWRAKRLLSRATLAWLRAETGHFDLKSFRYKLKQWNCTKNFFTLSIVCELTRKTFWVNIFVLKAKYVKLFTLRMKKLVSKLLVSRQLRIETTSNPSRDSPNCRACLQARGEVTRDNSKPQFLAQQSVAMLKQCCNHSKQYRNNVATLYCAKNRRCELSRVT